MSPQLYGHSNVRLNRILRVLRLLLLCEAPFLWAEASGQRPPGYHVPPEAVARALDGPPVPVATASPNGRWLVVQYLAGMPSLDELARPLVRIGDRIDPRTNSRWYPPIRAFEVITLYDVTREARTNFIAPSGVLGKVVWSPDGKHFAFLRKGSDRTELWIGDPQTGRSTLIAGLRLNAARVAHRFGRYLPCRWFGDSVRLLCLAIPETRGLPPSSDVSEGPLIQETTPKTTNLLKISFPTDQLLKGPNDEALYEYYMASQLEIIDLSAAPKRMRMGPPRIYEQYDPSPDGKHVLTVTVERPYSYAVPPSRFPKAVTILSSKGEVESTVAHLPPDTSGLPDHGWAPAGRRTFFWRPTAAATLAYYEALDGGDPTTPAKYRDRLMLLPSPFGHAPIELFRSEYRMGWVPVRTLWGNSGTVITQEYNYTDNHRRIWKINADDTHAAPQLLFDFHQDDLQARPGELVTAVTSSNGGMVLGRDEILANDAMLLEDEGNFFLRKEDPSESGERSMIQRFDPLTQQQQTVFVSADEAVEQPLSILRFNDRMEVVTTFETPTQPQNVRVIDVRTKSVQSVTNISDAAPQITRAQRRHLEYLRRDGVHLQGDLFLPSDYQPGQKLPLIVWGYPMHYRSDRVAAEIRRASNSFRGELDALSPLTLLTQGYAVFEAGMAVIGGADFNNDAPQQLADDARAAVEELVQIGVADRARIGIAGHSYGGLMVASVLETTNLFAAGAAFSGIFNLTMLPEGFQDEERSYWQAPELYDALSPLRHADKMHAPILLVHGGDDESPTKPLQSVQMFNGLRAVGAKSRLVILPYEFHTPVARESVLDAQWEMLNWFNRYLKDGKDPR